MRVLVIVALLLCGFQASLGQSFVFGVKGGMILGLQQWNGFNRDPLFSYHGDLFIESWNEENRFTVYAASGYHVRGSTLRTRGWFDPEEMISYSGGKSSMEFHNLALNLGVKQKFPFGVDSRAYYLLGVRGEYTLDTKFDSYFEVYEDFQNDFIFGMSVGGGIEIPFSRYVGGLLEVSVHPDLTKQLFLSAQDTGFTDPSTGNSIIINEQEITNLTFEITLGIRFLREVVYID